MGGWVGGQMKVGGGADRWESTWVGQMGMWVDKHMDR